MNMTVYQTIGIHYLRIDLVSNASVVQIGTAGAIQALANLHDTGGFGTTSATEETAGIEPIVVPLPSPTG
ncbi:spore germination protein GerPB [Gorillibacterium timonense]|uniref:spore germination protein GerPB n=1 Tax=Gorillibacterium timonense TaxID=1689269 RepID=UPI00071E579D|nr:spore germination protein GerPB [Gorillibacterium timonense]